MNKGGGGSGGGTSPTWRKPLISMNVKLQTTFTFSLVALVTCVTALAGQQPKSAALQLHVSSRCIVLVAESSFCQQVVLQVE